MQLSKSKLDQVGGQGFPGAHQKYMGCANASQIFFIFVISLLGQNWSASIVNSMSTLCVHLLCEESSISVDNHDFCFSYHVFITESCRLWSKLQKELFFRNICRRILLKASQYCKAIYLADSSPLKWRQNCH